MSSELKKLLLIGIAALFLATGAARAAGSLKTDVWAIYALGKMGLLCARLMRLAYTTAYSFGTRIPKTRSKFVCQRKGHLLAQSKW
jgi:hypothetical protein